MGTRQPLALGRKPVNALQTEFDLDRTNLELTLKCLGCFEQLYWVSADFTKERKLTYAELSALSKRAAIGFASLGIKKGDRVLIQLPRICEWWIALFGLMRVGAVPVPGTTLLVSSGEWRSSDCLRDQTRLTSGVNNRLALPSAVMQRYRFHW